MNGSDKNHIKSIYLNMAQIDKDKYEKFLGVKM